MGDLKARVLIARDVDTDRTAEIRATFQRIQRPLRRSLGDFRRKRVVTRRFHGYTFSRVRGREVAGIAYGFALHPDVLPAVREPPEAVVYVFVRPVDSDLHRTLVDRPRSVVRRLVQESRGLARPFELHADLEAVAVRHRAVGRLPPELFVLSAADFFMDGQRPIQASGLLRRIAAATHRPRP